MLSRKNIHQALFLFLSIFIAITLPFTDFLDAKLNSIAIIFLLLNWLLEGNLVNKGTLFIKNKYALLYSLPFFLNLLGLLYTNNLDEGMRIVMLSLSLFILPLVYSTSEISDEKVKIIILFFSVSVILATFYLFKDGFVYTFGDWYNPHHITINKREIITRVYCSVYLTFIFFSFLFFFNKEKKFSLVNILIALYIFYYLYLNGILIVKTTIIATIFIALVMLNFHLIHRRKGKLVLFFNSTLIALLVIMFSVNQRVKEVVDSTLNENPVMVYGSGTTFEMNSFSTRAKIWSACIKILEQDNNWIMGVGTGDVVVEIKKKYAELKFPDNMYADAHNQYIQTTLSHGVIGLLVLLSILILPIRICIKNNNYLYLSFLLLCFFCMFTESWFGRQAGLVFYAFFNSLFAFHSLNKKAL